MSANDELQAHTCEKMLEFYGNVANNVAQGNLRDLTEQWKKGELDVLDKLIKQIETINNNRALSDEYLENNGLSTREDYNIVGEWGYGIVWVIVDYVLPYLKQTHQLHKFLEEFNALEVAKENQQLKELIKEAKDIIEWYKADCGYKDALTEVILTKIDNAIGEKK